MTERSCGVQMPRKMAITKLLKLLAYDASSGAMEWRERDETFFKDFYRWNHIARRKVLVSASAQAQGWNARYATKKVGCVANTGYIQIYILDGPFLAHRLAWAIHYGKWPIGGIDHINGVQTDNRILNLREASALENGKNQKLRITNKSGANGVARVKSKSPWVAKIGCNGKSHYIGCFPTKEMAIDARKKSGLEMGFHINHGLSQSERQQFPIGGAE